MKKAVRASMLFVTCIVAAAAAMIPALRTQAGDCPGVKCNPPTLIRYASTQNCVGDMYQNGGCWDSQPNMKCDAKQTSQPWTDCQFGEFKVDLGLPAGGYWKLGGSVCRCHTFNGPGNLTLEGCSSTAIPANCE